MPTTKLQFIDFDDTTYDHAKVWEILKVDSRAESTELSKLYDPSQSINQISKTVQSKSLRL